MLAAALYLFFIGLLVYWISKTDVYLHDSTPDAAALKVLKEEGYPPSITRIVEAGYSAGMAGDGEHVIIYCFDPKVSQEIANLVGEKHPWLPGLPTGEIWGGTLEELIPKDISIGTPSDTSAYIYTLLDPESSEIKIIDIVKGIYYHITVYS